MPEGLDAAAVRALLAAKQYGVVRVKGGYGGHVASEVGNASDKANEETVGQFASERAVRAMLRRGLIRPGEAANTSVLTVAGHEKLKEYDAYLDEMDKWRHECAEYNRKKRNGNALAEHYRKRGGKAKASREIMGAAA